MTFVFYFLRRRKFVKLMTKYNFFFYKMTKYIYKRFFKVVGENFVFIMKRTYILYRYI